MNEELFAVSVVSVQSEALLVSHNGFGNCPMLSQPKSAVHQQAAKLFQQHWRHLKGNYDLNSAFENADRLLKQRRTSSQFYYIAPLVRQFLSQHGFIFIKIWTDFFIYGMLAWRPVTWKCGNALFHGMTHSCTQKRGPPGVIP
jgi:hypothetical protein